MKPDGTIECPECGADVDGTDWEGYKPFETSDGFTFQGKAAQRPFPYVVCDGCGEEIVV